VRRATTMIVTLLAVLLVLHVGLPHHGEQRSAAATIAEHRGGPAPQVLHIADADRAALPERLQAMQHAVPAPALVALTVVVACEQSTSPPVGVRASYSTVPPAPNLATLGVYRC
jgi:hypothetical protein